MEGYRKLAYKLGYESSCAVPWTEDLVSNVVHHLMERMHAHSAGTDRDLAIAAVAARDAAGLTLAWETAMRGKEVCSLRASDFYLPGVTCKPAWTAIREGAFDTGTVVLVERGLGIKQDASSTSGVVRLHYRHEGVCALSQLHVLAIRLTAAGAAANGFLLRPLNSNLISFKDCALDAAVLSRQLQEVLKRLGLWAGHTAHGLKRGKLQTELQEGASLSDVSAGRHADEGMTARYLHPTAHKRRLRATD